MGREGVVKWWEELGGYSFERGVGKGEARECPDGGNSTGL